MQPKIRLLILDDHTIFLNGLIGILKNHIGNCEIDAYSSILELEKKTTSFDDYDIFITDLEIPNESAIDLIIRIKSISSIPILVITMHNKLSLISTCKKYNVEGYILKDEFDELIKATSALLTGKPYYSQSITKRVLKRNENMIILSDRENEVIRLIAMGYTNKQISEALFISIETVKAHKRNIRIKLNMDKQSELVEYARNNLLF